MKKMNIAKDQQSKSVVMTTVSIRKVCWNLVVSICYVAFMWHVVREAILCVLQSRCIPRFLYNSTPITDILLKSAKAEAAQLPIDPDTGIIRRCKYPRI